MLVCAGVLIQSFALEPFQVPTGSMAPALVGHHRSCVCPGCGMTVLVVTHDVTDAVRTEAAAAGALACLAKPLGPRLLLDFLRSRTTGPTAQGQPQIHPTGSDQDHDDDVDTALMDRLQEMYVNALPRRLSAITTGARTGNAAALEFAAQTLAGTSGQLGHPEVASVCRAIASDARRGILAHARLVELRQLAVAH